MSDPDPHPYVEWIAREARRPVDLDPALRPRIMAAVRAEPVPQREPRFWGRVFEPRQLRLSIAGSALIAAGLIGIGILSGTLLHDRDVRSPGGPSLVAVVPQSQLPVSSSPVKFVFVAPQAGHVSLVGDFNGWDSTRTPMVRGKNGGVWSVELPLSAGRYMYAFVVDGSWNSDPGAPLAPDEGFGHANSVKVVRRGTAL